MITLSKTILITGGAGYIGSHIALLLIQQGHSVILVDSLMHRQAWPTLPAHRYLGDCGDVHFMNRILQKHAVDAVIHCAASIDVGESVENPIAYYQNNVSVTLNLLQVLSNFQIKKILFASSCAVYGKPQSIPLDEEHPQNPLSPYGMSKLMGERIIQDAAHAHDFSYVIFRYFNAAGALSEHGLGPVQRKTAHVIPRLIESAYNGSPFTLYGNDYATIDGTCVRDYTHVVDIAQAHLRALTYLDEQDLSAIFNLGSGAGVTVLQLIEAVEMVTQKSIKIIRAPRREGDSPALVADCTKAQTILGWRAEHSTLKQIINSAFSFYSGQERAAQPEVGDTFQ